MQVMGSDVHCVHTYAHIGVHTSLFCAQWSSRPLPTPSLQEITMELPWDDEAEAAKLHNLDLVDGAREARECESPAVGFSALNPPLMTH